MGTTRRDFVRWATMAACASAGGGGTARVVEGSERRQSAIEQAFTAPVLRKDLWPQPVRIASVELLHPKDQFLVRVRSKDGATGLAVGHPDVLETTWPILTRRVAPTFINKDARDLESLIEAVDQASSN